MAAPTSSTTCSPAGPPPTARGWRCRTSCQTSSRVIWTPSGRTCANSTGALGPGKHSCMPVHQHAHSAVPPSSSLIDGPLIRTGVRGVVWPDQDHGSVGGPGQHGPAEVPRVRVAAHRGQPRHARGRQHLCGGRAPPADAHLACAACTSTQLLPLASIELERVLTLTYPGALAGNARAGVGLLSPSIYLLLISIC